MICDNYFIIYCNMYFFIFMSKQKLINLKIFFLLCILNFFSILNVYLVRNKISSKISLAKMNSKHL